MNCKENVPLVEAFFDAELDERTTQRVARHLDVCGACSAIYRSLEREQELFLRYDCRIQESQSFWERVIERAKDPAHASLPHLGLRGLLGNSFANLRRRRMSPLLAASLMILAIGVTVLLMRVTSPQRTTTPVSNAQSDAATGADSNVSFGALRVEKKGTAEDRPGQTPLASRHIQTERVNQMAALTVRGRNSLRFNDRASGSSRPPTPDDLVRAAERNYVAAITMLARDVGRRRSQLDTNAAARFEQTLAAVDRTIADTRRAVRSHPGDPLAAKYLLAAYSRKVDVLRAMIDY